MYLNSYLLFLAAAAGINIAKADFMVYTELPIPTSAIPSFANSVDAAAWTTSVALNARVAFRSFTAALGEPYQSSSSSAASEIAAFVSTASNYSIPATVTESGTATFYGVPTWYSALPSGARAFKEQQVEDQFSIVRQVIAARQTTSSSSGGASIPTAAPFLDKKFGALAAAAAAVFLTTNGAWQKPAVIFSPGAGKNAITYSTLSSELASQGYTVLALDHPGEAPYLQLPNGAPGVYGIDVAATWNYISMAAVYNMRIFDTLAIIRKLLPSYVESIGAPFNTTHYFAIGRSLGGAAAAGALAVEPSILGGVNLDGLFIDLPDVKKPFLMLAGAQHTPALDVSWSPFSANQSGWYHWLNVTGTSHQDFSDLGDWVDLQGLRNKTITPSLGLIWAPRMDFIVKTLVESFLSFVLGGQEFLDAPNENLPEVGYINGSACIP
ncbi:hypothetical protein ST47_g5204 [Ascochyta rabiei]|uniref:Uncharacterized protein n=2 Tax=Didymella rabiei TaxID=5454 RepID=A0A163EDV4_DIDRA|nr:hypothetical protein ST47_g5204 [Ascochyta rabiei]